MLCSRCELHISYILHEVRTVRLGLSIFNLRLVGFEGLMESVRGPQSKLNFVYTFWKITN